MKRGARPGSDLIVVSNRLPYNLPREGPLGRNVGGLVNALEPVLSERGGSWVGWDGESLPSADAIQRKMRSPQAYRTPSGIQLHGVPLRRQEVSGYYQGFSNETLWPLFHDFTGKAVFDADAYRAYVQVNSRFAEIVAARASPSTHVWVQDFHLMLVPRFLRDLGFRGRIDFFLHIPFPPAEIYRRLPWRDEILRGLLGSDAVGFHVQSYRDNFIEAARRCCGARRRGPERDGRITLEHGTGECRAFAAPIGIDVEAFEELARSAEVRARAGRLREALGGRVILFGADRLDYTKGILERLRSVERYLATHPGAIGKVVLLQVVVPGRHQVDEYRELKREVDRVVGRINGEYGRGGWQPIHYRYRALERKELVACYMAADAAIVTPLRDGMNLVAAEFIASRVDQDGILILSEFAGVAERAAGAILVNPHDLDRCAQAIGRALSMTAEERRERMGLLRRQIRSNTAARWAERCLEDPRGRRRSAPSRKPPPRAGEEPLDRGTMGA